MRSKYEIHFVHRMQGAFERNNLHKFHNSKELFDKKSFRVIKTRYFIPKKRNKLHANLLGFCYLVQIIIMNFWSAMERTTGRRCAKTCDSPKQGRVFFCHVIYPVLNSTPMSFICKYTTVDNLSFTKDKFRICLLL